MIPEGVPGPIEASYEDDGCREDLLPFKHRPPRDQARPERENSKQSDLLGVVDNRAKDCGLAAAPASGAARTHARRRSA
jgi:hypothetical protein